MSRRAFDRFMVDGELGSNPKLGRFTDAQFRCLISGVWALAAKAEPRGYLAVAGQPATDRDVAHQARCSVPVARSTLALMRELRMLDRDEDGLDCCHDWPVYNPDPRPSETAEAWRDRKRAERQRKRQGHATVTRDTRNGHDPEVEVEVEGKETSPSQAEQHPVALALCHRLADHIRRNDPKADPKPDSDGWVREMRLLVNERQDASEVRRIIDWCQADPFWRSNILSPGKLRKQFTQLVLKAGAVVDGNIVSLPRPSLQRANAWAAGYSDEEAS